MLWTNPGKVRLLLHQKVVTLARLEAIRHKFRGYLKQLPVIGFNSARYDLNLMKSDLIPYLKMQIEHEDKRKAELRKQRENNRQRFGNG